MNICGFKKLRPSRPIEIFTESRVPRILPGWKPFVALKTARAICARTPIFGVHGTCLKKQHVAKFAIR